MKNVRIRLLSSLLAVAMLVSLVPAAFAASSFDGETDSDGLCYLIGDADFDEEDLYENSDAYYFWIESIDSDAPGVYQKNSKKDTDVEETLIHYEDLDDVYFDEYDSDCKESYYRYRIEAYEKNDVKDEYYVGYTTFYLYVNGNHSGSGSSSSDGDIYAETDRDGYLDLDDVAGEIYDFAYDDMSKDTPEYVIFTDCTNGYLYYGSSEKDAEDEKFYFEGKGSYLDEAVTFEIKDEDKEAEIDFTVYGDGSEKSYGTIIVNGDGTSSSKGDITYSCDYNGEVYFEGDDFVDLLSSSQELDYVTFTLPSSSKGTLYIDGSKLSAKDELDEDDLDDVSFTAKSGATGNVSISFKMYYYKNSSSSSRSSKSGTVVVSIADGKTITYSCPADGEVELDGDDFDDVCYDQTGKYLDYVKFSLPSSGKGTLYAEYDGTSRGSTAAKSSDKFYLDPGRNDYALDDVVFVPKGGGTCEFSYTGYDTKGKSFTGKVKVTVSAGSLGDITYQTGSRNEVTFKASDFTSALKAKASGKTLSYVTFTLPGSSQGTLYYNGSTKVNANTQYKASGSTNSLDKVSFVPAGGATGDVTISYAARDTSGNTYNGKVIVKTFVGQDTVISYSTTGSAATFQVSDFSNACTRKLNTTLAAVQFALPDSSQGTLYYGYGSPQQTYVTANTKYSAATYLKYISFLPKAGFSGTATITYVGYDLTDGYYAGTIQVTVAPPTRSAHFTDAGASWLAPAVDFLYDNGVYDGMVGGSTLGTNEKITRGEVMHMIYNAFGLKNRVLSVTSNFKDVPATHPYYTAINAGAALGIAQGYDGSYRPEETITREDAMTLLYRAFTTLGLKLTTGSSSDLSIFPDGSTVASYAVNASASMVRSGIIQGDQNGNFLPKGDLTRGELSVILHRAMTL